MEHFGIRRLSSTFGALPAAQRRVDKARREARKSGARHRPDRMK
jgi:hypothetical protein